MLASPAKVRQKSDNLRAGIAMVPGSSTLTGNVAIISSSISVLVSDKVLSCAFSNTVDNIGKVERRSTMLQTNCNGRSRISWETVNFIF